MALSICLPVDACPPVIGRIRPIFTVSCARAGAKASVEPTAPAIATTTAPRDNIFLPINMNALPDRFRATNRVPGPCRTITQIFQPRTGAARNDVNLDDGRDYWDG